MKPPNERLFTDTVTVYPISYGEASHGGSIPQDGTGVTYKAICTRIPLDQVRTADYDSSQARTVWQVQIRSATDPLVITDQHIQFGTHTFLAMGPSAPRHVGAWIVQCMEVV